MPRPPTDARLALVFRKQLAKLYAASPADELAPHADQRFRTLADKSGVELPRVLQCAVADRRVIPDEDLARAIQVGFCRKEAMDELLSYANRQSEIYPWIKTAFGDKRLSYAQLAWGYEVPEPTEQRDKDSLFQQFAFDLATQAYNRTKTNCLQRYDATRPYAAWYHSDLGYTYLDLKRNWLRQRVANGRLPVQHNVEEEELGEDLPPDDRALEHDLIHLIERLPPDQRAVINKLRLGLTPQEIAAKLAIDINRLYKMIEKARKTLRGWLWPVVWGGTTCVANGGMIHCDATLDVRVAPGRNKKHRIAIAVPAAGGHGGVSLHPDPLQLGTNKRSFDIPLNNGFRDLRHVRLIVVEMPATKEEPMLDLASEHVHEVSRETVDVQRPFGSAAAGRST